MSSPLHQNHVIIHSEATSFILSSKCSNLAKNVVLWCVQCIGIFHFFRQICILFFAKRAPMLEFKIHRGLWNTVSVYPVQRTCIFNLFRPTEIRISTFDPSPIFRDSMKWTCDGSFANQILWFLSMFANFAYKRPALFSVGIWEWISLNYPLL
jgi:hypothetical protein